MNKKLCAPSIFTNENIYFQEGCKYISPRSGSGSFVFIQFEKCFLKKILNFDFLIHGDLDFVLFSDSTMMPLALYLMKKNNNVKAVFEKRTSISTVLGALGNQTKMMMIVNEIKRKKTVLTEMEFLLLKAYEYTGGGVGHQAAYFNMTPKSVYYYRRSIIKKMGLRKIEQLLSMI